MKTQSPHLHSDTKVTIERLDSFAEASREHQVSVLAKLRARAEDDANDIQTTILVGAFGVLGTLLVAPNVAGLIQKAGTGSWVVGLSAGAGIGVVIAIVMIPIVFSAVVRGARRERATVWLRAYEDELQRRWQLPGRGGRAWRRAH